ncbi:c-type cytochrome [Agriterribacter sp.]|uniref:c-type cytochrome n=1 Tax=Agriterribacter sp. TaxID=2821509 RepID=UPI002C5D2F18|nr:c-type cytochrome [Agriterribacter sp.]HRO47036.1 c-type cytochrome [Agriterribacter sp.]HRQ17812.1 c-type cytochrome [Agriterribacter sp.]
MYQLHKKKLLAGISLICILLVGVAATTVQDKKPKPNLKVLPKDISHEELEKIMKGFNVSLGVKCNHCHAPSKTDAKKLDFSSDDKPEKNVARDMMRMTAKINKKYFDYGGDGHAAALTCITCHNGKAHPESKITLPPPPPER